MRRDTIFLRGESRAGPTFREAVLTHAVARIVFDGLINNIEASWVKMGAVGARACLEAGVNDLGGALMAESITGAAGSVHGQEFAPANMEALIRSTARIPRQRLTDYRTAQPRLDVVAA